jgi:hypothetical protein
MFGLARRTADAGGRLHEQVHEKTAGGGLPGDIPLRAHEGSVPLFEPEPIPRDCVRRGCAQFGAERSRARFHGDNACGKRPVPDELASLAIPDDPCR